jgi:PTH1 family peptidyl-tRNA hydrolase
MKLIFGLGNLGKKYQNTRHNLGQQILQSYCQKNSIDLRDKINFAGRVGESSKNFFAHSLGYMNNSGVSLTKISNYYKITPENILVIHDDLDLPVGEWRLQFDRSPAGHNGIKSIVGSLGTQAFYRLRVGIDHPRNSDNPQILPEDYVLLPFSTSQKVIFDQTIDKIHQEISDFLSNQIFRI